MRPVCDTCQLLVCTVLFLARVLMGGAGKNIYYFNTFIYVPKMYLFYVLCNLNFFFFFEKPTHFDYAVGSNFIQNGYKFLTNLYQKQMNQFTQIIQFWIVNAMVNSSVHAYYIMLIIFFS